jgi:phosphatidylglycerol:prolipoprotein diacylglycerol transferase
MFPTLNHLLYYLFNVRLPFTIQTLGLFVALAFVGAYQVFKSEFKRYEAAGKISAITKIIVVGKYAFILNLVINAMLGFVLGYKIGGILFQFGLFKGGPAGYIFSLQGNFTAGILSALVFGLWVYSDQKDELHIKASKPVEKTVHPWQLMGMIIMYVGVAGVIGSKLFDVAEHIEIFIHAPLSTLFKSTGYNYYGGLIFGALTFFYIGYKHKMKVVHLADIGSSGMMLAYGIGRIGCQLAGDGDWGIMNAHPKPQLLQWLPDWMWSFRFPHNAIEAGINIPGCDGNFCNQLVKGVYPTSFYEAVWCIGLFLLMWLFRKKIVTPGAMFFTYLVANGTERLLIEFIRINYRYQILGMHLTQAQVIGGLMVMGGLAGFLYLAFHQRTGLKI